LRDCDYENERSGLEEGRRVEMGMVLRRWEWGGEGRGGGGVVREVGEVGGESVE